MSIALSVLDGVHVQGTILWLDATRPRDLSFVSSGHLRRRSGDHKQLLATPPTVRFMRQRLGAGDALIVPYNRPFTLGGLRLELLPGGSMLGSAQLLLERGDERMVYTGPLGPTEGIDTADRPQLRRCDRLVIVTHRHTPLTRGARRHGREHLLAAVRETVDAHRIAIVLCDPLGMAQEIASWCRRERWRVRAHRSIAAFTHEYRRFGRDPGPTPELRRWPREAHGPVDADVILYPRLLAHSPILMRVPRRRFIVAWPGKRTSDELPHAEHVEWAGTHASIEELVTYARTSQARRVHVLGNRAERLIRPLRALGADVSVLGPPHQRVLFPELREGRPDDEPPTE